MTNPNLDVEKMKANLESEVNLLTQELNSIATKDPKSPGEWGAKAEDSEPEFREEVADRMEDQENREATTEPLEERLKVVQAALQRIEKGTFGKCEICDQEIEADRLEVNPAARTCKAHLDQESKLN